MIKINIPTSQTTVGGNLFSNQPRVFCSIKSSISSIIKFIQEITQKSPNNVGVSFINKKAPAAAGLLVKSVSYNLSSTSAERYPHRPYKNEYSRCCNTDSNTTAFRTNIKSFFFGGFFICP